MPNKKSAHNKLSLPEQEILKMYIDNKMSINEISSKLNCSWLPIKKVLEKNNISLNNPNYSRKRKNSKRFDELESKIIELSKTENIENICRNLKCSRDIVNKVLKKNNIQPIKNNKTPFKGHITKETLYDLYYNQNKSYKDIAIIFNCGAAYISKLRKKYDMVLKNKSNIKFKGHGEIRLNHWNHILQLAKKRNIEFNITIEYIWELFLKQNRKCSLTGCPLTFDNNYNNAKLFRTASLDRIDSSKGYIEGNVQWVHKDINVMKWHFNEKYFKQLCHLVANNSLENWWY